jgi:hypothetical protein
MIVEARSTLASLVEICGAAVAAARLRQDADRRGGGDQPEPMWLSLAAVVDSSPAPGHDGRAGPEPLVLDCHCRQLRL